MRKVIAGMNMTLDGFCDHTVMNADDEMHDHYTDVLRNGGALLYGRTTYQLMEDYWPTVLESPTGNAAMDDFAAVIDEIPKIVFSHTLSEVTWKTARLASGTLSEEIHSLKQQPGKDIFIGSPGLILQAANLGLVDEFQISVHPILIGKGLSLFNGIENRIDLKLTKTKTFSCGAITLYYEPVRSNNGLKNL